jgi:hypothetical protein
MQFLYSLLFVFLLFLVSCRKQPETTAPNYSRDSNAKTVAESVVQSQKLQTETEKYDYPETDDLLGVPEGVPIPANLLKKVLRDWSKSKTFSECLNSF